RVHRQRSADEEPRHGSVDARRRRCGGSLPRRRSDPRGPLLAPTPRACSAPVRGKLVVAHPDRKAQRTLQRLVGARSWPVEVAADLDAACAAVDATTIAVVDAALARTRPDVRTQPALAWVAVPGEGAAPADPAVVSALLAAGWDHVISHPMPLLAEELVVTAQKLIRREVFGLDKYMAWGAGVRDYKPGDARDRDAMASSAAAEIAKVGLPDRICSLVSVVADELLANALYSAPVDAAGARFRADEPRDKPRALVG